VRRSVLLLAALAVTAAGCGDVTALTSPGERMARDVGFGMERSAGAAADVSCTRELTRDFSCRTYRPLKANLAAQATYAVHRCRRGGWRARRVSGSKVFPVALRFDEPNEKPSKDCVG
jgi:hypothetical protein